MGKGGYEEHARACMSELVKHIERDPVDAHRYLDRMSSNWFGRGMFVGTTVATTFFVALHWITNQ